MIRNVHRRHLPVDPAEVWDLVARLGGPDDELWPSGWPSARLAGPMEPGTPGRHGPVAYVVERVEPGRLVSFRFTAPRGFHGHHRFEVVPAGGDAGGTILEHHVETTADPLAWLSWWAFIRPLHDALVEELLDRAERATTGRLAGPAAARSPWVRLLRRLPRSSPPAGDPNASSPRLPSGA